MANSRLTDDPAGSWTLVVGAEVQPPGYPADRGRPARNEARVIYFALSDSPHPYIYRAGIGRRWWF